MWRSPLPFSFEVPIGDHPGAFGARRKFDRHTGVDLYVPMGTKVTAVEDGQVVAVIPFTGPEAESPWWLPTWAVLVEGTSGVVLYGEIEPTVTLGPVRAGDVVGSVLTVLQHDKGRPTAMLHLELYEQGTRDCVWWREGEQPKSLLDPTEQLKKVSP